MTAPPLPTEPGIAATGIAERLERGEVVYHSTCPFPLPAGTDSFLLEQSLGRGHKNISYDPHTSRAGGFRRHSRAQAERLRELLADFSRNATAWLAGYLPRYARAWRLDQVSYRPEEEATRRLRRTSRNDLLHVDAFPRRPTNGWRILRLFVNVNPSAARVWITADPFARLLERYGEAVGLPSGPERLPGWLGRLLGKRQRSAYDSFMLRFHNYLKANDDFQSGPRQVWHFPPGSLWLAFTDSCSHAVLSGRYALEHSYFVSPDGLAVPAESPAALLARACGQPVLCRAA
jgi:hypothetical protein